MKHPLVLFVSSALLAGSATAQQVERGGTLQLAVDQSPVGLDPQIATAFSTFVVTGQIYESLADIDAKLKVRPLLATK